MLVDIPAELDARVACLKTQLHDFDRTGDVRAATSEPLAIEYVANLVNAARQALRSHAHEQAQQWLLECEQMTREDSHWLTCFGPQERVRTALRAEVYVLLAEHSIQTCAGCVQAQSFLEFAQLESGALPATLASAASLLLDMGCPELALAPAQSAVYTLTREVARIGNTISNVRKCTVRVTVRERHRLVTELCRACGLLAHCYCVLARAHGGPGAAATRHRTAALHQALHHAKEAESAAGRHAIFEQGEDGYRSNDSDPYWANGLVDYRTATPELPQLASQTRTGSLLHGFTEVPPSPRRVAQFAEKALPAQEAPAAAAAADTRFDGVRAPQGHMVSVPPVQDEAPSLPEPVFHVLHPLPPGAAPANCPQARPHRRHGPFADLDFGVGPPRREGKLCVRSTPRATIVVSTGTITMGSAQVSHALAGDIHQLLPPGFFGALLPVHCMVACDARGDMYVATVCKKAALRLNGFEVGTAVHALNGGDRLVLGSGESRVEIHVKKTPERGQAASPQTPPAPPPGPPPNRLNQRRPSTSTDDGGNAGAPLVSGHSQIVRRSSGIIGRILINKYDPGREWTELESATLPQYLAHLKDEMDSEECALSAPRQQTTAASTEPAQKAPPQPQPPPPPAKSPLPCIDKVFTTCADPATELPFLHSLVALRNSMDPASLPPCPPRGGQEGGGATGGRAGEEGRTTPPPLTFTEKCELMYPVPPVARSHAGRRVSVILESDEGGSATTSSDSDSSTGGSSSSGSVSGDSDTDCRSSGAAADDTADGAAARPPDDADALTVLALACRMGRPEDQRRFAGLDAVSAALAISCPGHAGCRLLHEEKAHVDDAPSPSPPSPADRETPGAAELEETLYSALRSVMGTIDDDGVDTSAAPLGLEKDDVNDLAGPPTPPLARSGTLRTAPALAAVLASFPSGDGGIGTYLHGVSVLTPVPLFSSFRSDAGAAADAAAAAAPPAAAPRKKSFVVFTTEPDEIIPPSPCVCTPPPDDRSANEAAAEASAHALRLVRASFESADSGDRGGGVGSYLSGVAALAPEAAGVHTTTTTTDDTAAAAAAQAGELGVPTTLPALRHLVDVSREPETGRQTCQWLPFVVHEASSSQPGSPTDGYPAMHVMLGGGEETGYPSLNTLLRMTTGS